MRRLILLLAVLCLSISSAFGEHSDLRRRIEAMEDVRDIEQMPSGEFAEKYEVMVQTQLDWHNPDAGSFLQRIFVMHVGFDRPTLVITQGYGAGFAEPEKYRDEISQLFDTNIIFVEHRYFDKSTPEPCDWRYLTAENSAYDLHHLVTMFKELYKGKWISSGISKGGTTTMLYRAYFPDDVDISVPYVGPLCDAVEDARFEPFLEKIGTDQVRNAVRDFQIRLFERKDVMIPLLEAYSAEKGYKYRMPIKEVFDYCVLEYSFSFWQWGHPADKIPAVGASDEEMFAYLMAECDPDYFSTGSANAPFFIQAARELGYYGYDTKPFERYLSIPTSRDYLRRIFLPVELQHEKFDKSLYEKVRRYLRRNDPKMIFIYGGDDPWTAPGAMWVEELDKKNMKVFVETGGSHRTRIATLPEPMRAEVIATIEKWLAE